MDSVRYAVITPARDEGQFLTDLIEDMLGQVARPQRWVIVDDGSDDDTADTVRQVAATNDWITLVSLPRGRVRLPGSGVIHAFNAGLERVDTRALEYIVKLDADLRIPPDYFGRIFQAFAERPFLGAAGGACVEDGKLAGTWPPYHVRGATKVYRAACFEDIGGLVPVLAWDGVDIASAVAHGWETCTLLEVRFEHRRPAGSHPDAGGIIGGRLRQGRGNYVLNSLPLTPILRAMRIALRRPPLLGSLALLWGYVSAFFSSVERVTDPETVRMQRLLELRKLVGLTDVRGLARRQRERRRLGLIPP